MASFELYRLTPVMYPLKGSLRRPFVASVKPGLAEVALCLHVTRCERGVMTC